MANMQMNANKFWMNALLTIVGTGAMTVVESGNWHAAVPVFLMGAANAYATWQTPNKPK